MSNRCQFIVGGHCDPKRGAVNDFCDAPAPIKHNGRWFCVEHYDQMEEQGGRSCVKLTE